MDHSLTPDLDGPLRSEFSGGLTFFLAAIAAYITILAVKAVLERLRWHRAGRRGFDAFLESGAPLRHERLLAAFADPGAFEHGGDRGRVFSLGTVTLPSGRLVLVTPDALDPSEEFEAFDVELPAERPLPVEGFALGDDPSWGFAALRIVVGDGDPVTLEPAFTSSWREGRAASERRIPHLPVESDGDVLIGAPEAIEEFARRGETDEDIYDEILLEAPKGFHKRSDLPPLSRVAAAKGDHLAVVVARTWLGEEHARTLLQRDDEGDVVAVFVDMGALGEPTWNWTPGR